MTLDEFVGKIDGDFDMYIGSKSGFLFIGNKKTYHKYIDAASLRIVKKLENYIRILERAVDGLKKKGEPTLGEHMRLDTLKHLIECYYRKLDTYNENIRRYKERVKKFKPLRGRMVLNAYNKLNPEDGVVIIVEGEEEGEYWLKEEFRLPINP